MTFQEAIEIELARFDAAVATMRECLVDPAYQNPRHEVFRNAKNEADGASTDVFELRLTEWRVRSHKQQ